MSVGSLISHNMNTTGEKENPVARINVVTIRFYEAQICWNFSLHFHFPFYVGTMLMVWFHVGTKTVRLGLGYDDLEIRLEISRCLVQMMCFSCPKDGGKMFHNVGWSGLNPRSVLSHRCSTEMGSGEFEGLVYTWSSFSPSMNNSWTILGVLQGALSCSGDPLLFGRAVATRRCTWFIHVRWHSHECPKVSQGFQWRNTAL